MRISIDLTAAQAEDLRTQLAVNTDDAPTPIPTPEPEPAPEPAPEPEPASDPVYAADSLNPQSGETHVRLSEHPSRGDWKMATANTLDYWEGRVAAGRYRAINSDPGRRVIPVQEPSWMGAGWLYLTDGAGRVLKKSAVGAVAAGDPIIFPPDGKTYFLVLVSSGGQGYVRHWDNDRTNEGPAR